MPPTDALTGALSMPLFAQAFSRDIVGKHLENTAIWFIDVRNFRSVNPKFSYGQGNAVLQSIVAGTKAVFGEDTLIARLGADRFALVSTELDFEAAEKALFSLADFVGNAAAANGVIMPLHIAAGIYYLRDFDYEKGTHNRALDYASIAHRNAKLETGTALVQFTDADLEKDTRRITIEQTIDTALAEGQIEVWYQPQVDYIYGDIIGAEALSRWNHPELGWIYPSEFIPILENCGKIHNLDLFVWEEACRSAGRWRNASDGKPVPISVNVSRREVYEEGLMEHFLELQRKYDLPEGSLHLEVTESAFVEEAEHLYKVINNMRAHNMLVEMDDFGSGLSSLNMLKDVPVDVVKLDMGFLRSTMKEDRGGVILGSVIRMLQGLDTPIIAEGVETLEQAEMLKNMGCRLMQGYHFSRPMPLAEFESFIASNKAVERSKQRERAEISVDDLASLDTASSYLFNNAMGATLFYFLMDDGTTESILVNDEFYECCGLDRVEFGNKRINPIEEIDEESRDTLFRAASESREYGAARCLAKVKRSGRWIDCIMRYLGPSVRGHVYSLNIYRWNDTDDEHQNHLLQSAQDRAWTVGILEKVMPGGFLKCEVNDELTLRYTSPVFLETSGLSAEEFMRRYHNSFIECIAMNDRANVLGAIRDGSETGALIECEFGVRFKVNSEQTVSMFARVETDEDDAQWLYAIVLFKDLDENGSKSESQRERIFPFEYDFARDELVIQSILPSGVEEKTVISNWIEKVDSLPDIITQASAAKVLATIRDLRHHPTSGFADLKCSLRGKNALRWYHINYSCEADENGDTTKIRGYAQDANDQIGSARWWRQQAEIDQLTGLLNRNAAEQDINLSMRTQGSGMMFMIDLDGFKRVNDELGHLTGDALLRDVAETLQDHFREGDVLGRYGGDEFVAFVPAIAGNPHEIAQRRSADIIRAISNIEIPDGTHAGCSVGVAISNNREATFYDLLEAADQAMYESKMSGKGTYTIKEME